ncbi:glycosyltransferase [Roseobacter sp. HKCCD9010]|uniref:glycosyltransferase n=1 Tax=unclassified Roseobacter TaxID=196798 RepID=UPI001490EECE|nr:glycosyltransferase [Rhodobacterales bacterium HKCCD4356]NNV12108.1 glycosyltransferase [Roseobacter sp. HKCCD7357]NNV17122.1 glycosyltransferase [Roseobacter sp. HKCCD8768]NNV26351.1 glycosyltransferase [Roseobacter sp. HKCCD8192]NNV30846.1 glycosyltransferase [Roseobacter sp. HKCCD9061]NNV35110.1 glycosyltransferase [Roseobacter sp. HKCCD9073]NNV39129.1 glycosyltransferase [Roseobacter sp. HKCCD9054]NNV43509.1 glycosyltransferase [Roseobacter sp. HKCCD6497]NNV47111.1 glycosyltransferas
MLPDVGESVPCVFPSGGAAKSILAWLLACFRLFWALCTSRVGAVYVVCSRTTPGFFRDLPGLLTVYLGKRVIVHCHGSDFESLLSSGPLSGLARRIYRNCEVIFPSHHLSERMKDRVKIAHLCENFFVAAEAAQSAANQDPSSLQVVWNSNVMASKGFFDVVSAVEVLVRQGHQIDLLCFGKVQSDHEMLEVDVRSKMRQYEGCDWFSYLGMVPHACAVGAIRDGDVVALPSRYTSEMQPLAVIEAMCSGKRVIVSDRASLRETVGDYPADIVPINNVPEIAKDIERLYHEKRSDPSKFKNKNIDAAIASNKRFSAEVFDLKMKDILLRGKLDRSSET